MGDFKRLLDLKRESALLFEAKGNRLAVCPDLGGRIFPEVNDCCPNRIDSDTVAHPGESFNNFGGDNFWPAPEGGKFGFNYRGDEWYVQPAINNKPFVLTDRDSSSACLQKRVALTNRAGAVVEAVMKRQFSFCEPPEILRGHRLRTWLAYETEDSFDVMNTVSSEQALLAAWTLDQFDASDDTVAFCAVPNPREAINFNFYEHPGDRIRYFSSGFAYKTDGQSRGQIGIKKDAHPSFIGFYDLQRRLVCLRENVNAGEGAYFNIADNDQPEGPYSAADTYSIFNSDPDMAAFELETVGSARTENGLVKGSLLVSRTTLAVFEAAAEIERFLESAIGSQG